MVKPQMQMSDEAIKAATGRDWQEWYDWIIAQGLGDLPHKDIVMKVHATGIRGWWSQSVTVGYERMIGRRAVGQRCDGAFSASASKTVTGDLDIALEKWLDLVAGKVEFDDALAESEPRQSQSPKWRYWKVDLDNGSKVQVTISEKGGGKSVIGIGHEKLADADAVAKSKAFWKDLLSALS